MPYDKNVKKEKNISPEYLFGETSISIYKRGCPFLRSAPIRKYDERESEMGRRRKENNKQISMKK